MKKLVPILIIILFVVQSIDAIPAFARKYKMSCQTCHSPLPRLKAYGDEFAGNGFVLSDKDSPRYFVNTGDSELSLIRDLPLAVRLDAYVTYTMTDDENKTDFRTPYLLKLMSGGALADNLSYYFYCYFDERGEVAGVEDAYIMFNNLFNSDLDIYVGQFQVSDPLFKRELRLTLEDYQLYKQKIGNAKANLAYDRGMMITYGMDTGTDIIFEIINGNGLVDADEEHNFDNNRFKNFAGRVSQDIGEFLRVGVFAYYGKENVLSNNNLFNTEIEYETETTYFGPDLTFNFDDIVELNAQYLNRKDDNNYKGIAFSTSPASYNTDAFMAELVITPNRDESKHYGVILYNYIESEFEEANYNCVSGHIGHVLRRNIRLVTEYKYDIEREFGMLSVGIVSAF